MRRVGGMLGVCESTRVEGEFNSVCASLIPAERLESRNGKGECSMAGVRRRELEAMQRLDVSIRYIWLKLNCLKSSPNAV